MLPACCSPGQDALKGSSPRGSVWPCPVVTPAHPHTHSPKTPHLQPRCCSAPCPSHGREDRAPEQQRRCFPSQQQECKTSATLRAPVCLGPVAGCAGGTHTALPALHTCPAPSPASGPHTAAEMPSGLSFHSEGSGNVNSASSRASPGVSPQTGDTGHCHSHGQGRLQPGPGGHRRHGQSRHSPCSPHIHRWSCLPPLCNQAASSSVPKR